MIPLSPQLEITTVVEACERAMAESIDRYMAYNRKLYMGYAKAIAPNRARWEDVWERFAFAILTANSEVASAVRAFQRAREFRGLPSVKGLHGITPERAKYVNALPLGDPILALLRQHAEPWDIYRLRIVRAVRGLALTKASYAVCLLYPLDADVACLDVWMQRIFLRNEHFLWLKDQEYADMEEQVRRYAHRHHVCTSLAQWMMWDWIRGAVPTPQRFFDKEDA